MTTSTQTQLRRGTNSQVVSMTPAAGEVVVDTTNNRLNVGNGTTAGGIVLPNAKDIQQLTFVYPTVGGTGDAITLTCVPPVASYAAPLRLIFKAGASNTTAVTVNVDTLGTKNIKKMLDGALAALVAGDIVSGGIYEIIYDGTQFQIQGLGQKTPATLPAAVTGTLTSGSTSDVFIVDFTTYAAYSIFFDRITANNSGPVTIDVSTDGGSTYATATRPGGGGGSELTLAGTASQELIATLNQNISSSRAALSYNGSAGTAGITTFSTSAAINRIKITVTSAGVHFTDGNVLLQPTVKR